MAEAFVYGVLKQLGSFAVQSIQEDLKLVVCLNNEVRKLTREFEIIQEVLVDAEQRQFTNTGVRVWLERLNDVSYDVDHVLDQWRTANLQIDGEADQHADTFMSKVCSCFLFPYLVVRVRRVALAINLSFKIKAINERLDDIAKTKDKYGLKITPTTGIIEQPLDRETTSFIDVPKVVGLDEQKKSLVAKLLNESCEEQNGLHTISIVGMGGIGKTTLAQLAYNDDEVVNFFEKRIWVCVSDSFNMLRIAKAILETLEGHTPNLSALQSLLDKISKSLWRKKFLIVLDDVWTEDYKDWEQVHNCLKNGLHGNKILITTRKQTTALIMKSIDNISIEELSEEHCWSLFKQLAFFGRSDKECGKLEGIGREIVSKCKRLPLAVKAMGGLLQVKRDTKEWKSILNSEMWKLEEFEKGISPLLVSYYNLPSMVKRCFTFCAMFPKDFNFEKDELIKLWMAQGYLGLDHNEELERIGEKYFNSLAMRSFFQEFEKDDDGSIIRCKMHDIVHDVAQYLSKNECCMIEVQDDFREESMNALCEKARHLKLMVEGSDTFPISICNFKKLRSLLIEFGDVEFDDVGSKSIVKVIPKLLNELMGLKALGISKAYIEHIPKEIGKVIHLRYLDLSNNKKLIKLPETLCELYNLQTLKLDWCGNLEELPQGIGKLINLRHLMNWKTDSLRYMPKGMERLIHLRTLNEFHLNSGDYGGKTCSLEFLGHIESLRIEGLKNLAKVIDEIVQLKNNKNIRDLGLAFRDLGL